MMVPPLSERPVTDEDEEQFRAESRACLIVCVSVFCLKGLMHDE